MTDLALLKELLALLDASSATTIEIRRGFTTYRVSREAGGGMVAFPASGGGGAVHYAAPAHAGAPVGPPPGGVRAAAPRKRRRPGWSRSSRPWSAPSTGRRSRARTPT